MTLAERDALDIVEKKILEVRKERARAGWRNDWRPADIRLENIRRYLLTHQQEATITIRGTIEC